MYVDTGKPTKHLRSWLALAVLATAVLAAVGCVNEDTPSAQTLLAEQSDGIETSELAGMYGWDPKGGFHNAVWSGTLVVDGPCAYLDVSQQDGVLPTPEDEPLRSFVRLPAPLTRHDAATGEVWVGGHGPMSTGDEVLLVGSEGWQLEWTQSEEDTHVFEYVWSDPADPMAKRMPVCAAHVSFYAASMSPVDPRDEEAVTESGSSIHLAGLFPWDTDQAAHDELMYAVLTIKPPCVYVGGGPSPSIASRYFVRLPRPLVRFDTASSAIWVGDHGPLKTGDEITMQVTGPYRSAYGSEPYEGACPARGDLSSVSMNLGVKDSRGAIRNEEQAIVLDGMTQAAGDESSELVGLRDYTGWEEGPAPLYEGVLLIEFPCVYLYPQEHIEGLYASQDSEESSGSPLDMLADERALLRMIRDWTRYDAETESIWNDDDGPMASGDRVNVTGVDGPPEGHGDVCSRDFDINADYVSLCSRHDCRIEREARLQQSKSSP